MKPPIEQLIQFMWENNMDLLLTTPFKQKIDELSKLENETFKINKMRRPKTTSNLVLNYEIKTPKVTNKEIADYKRDYVLLLSFIRWYHRTKEHNTNTSFSEYVEDYLKGEQLFCHKCTSINVITYTHEYTCKHCGNMWAK